MYFNPLDAPDFDDDLDDDDDTDTWVPDGPILTLDT